MQSRPRNLIRGGRSVLILPRIHLTVTIHTYSYTHTHTYTPHTPDMHTLAPFCSYSNVYDLCQKTNREPVRAESVREEKIIEHVC